MDLDSAARTRNKIFVYLALTFALSSIFYWRIISAGTLGRDQGLDVLGLMWCPGTAGLLTQLFFERSLRGLGWRWSSKYMAWSYLIPLLYAGIAYSVIWAAGWGQLDLTSPVAQPRMLFKLATLGILNSCISALGEEIGWRGFLAPHLAKITSFTRLSLISGIIWSVWHYPILLFADYNGGTPAWYSLGCFTLMVVSMSFVFAWVRLRSGSLWTGMMLHASHNLFVQAVFTRLTKDTGNTRYFIDEFGIVLPLVAVLTAVLFWSWRREVEQPAPAPLAQSAAAL